MAACVVPQTTTSRAYLETKNEVKVEDSEFDKAVTFMGVAEDHGPPVLGYNVNIFLIRSWLDKKTGATKHQLYFNDYHEGNGWRMWYAASDEKANDLAVIPIDHDVSCTRYSCSYFETVGVDLPDILLSSNPSQGVRIKLKAKNGEEKIITVTPNQINSQLSAIHAKKAALGISESPQKKTESSKGRKKRNS